MVKASLKDLVTAGQLGPVVPGMTRSELAAIVGEPDDYSVNSRSRERKRLPPAILKYGDIEFHFEDRTDMVSLVHLDDFTVPSGGAKLCLDPWIVQRDLTIDTLEAALHHDNIPSQRFQYDFDTTTIRLRTGLGVEFVFTVEQEIYGAPVGLSAISWSMPVVDPA